MSDGEKCRFCGEPTTSRGKQIFEGKRVEMVECKNCGIAKMVATKDLPLLDNTS